MKTCQCPKLLHVKDVTYKSARVLLVNVVQYVLQNVIAKRGASLLYIHFYLHEGTSPVNADCLARRLLTYICGKRCFYWIYYKNSNFIIFHFQILTINNTS